MSTSLLAGGVLDAASFALYLYAARRVLRVLPADRGHATEAFALFWFGVALVNLLQAGLVLLALWTMPTLDATLAVWNTRIVLALVSFAGLVYYLTFVYTGSSRLRGPIVVAYSATLLVMELWLFGATPVGVDVVGWRVDLRLADGTASPLYPVVVALFFLPPLVASAAYALTLRFASDPRQRRRIALVSLSLAGYFGGMTVGYLHASWPWWGLVENILGLGAGLGLVAALRGPPSTHGFVARFRTPSAELEARVRQLV